MEGWRDGQRLLVIARAIACARVCVCECEGVRGCDLHPQIVQENSEFAG